MTETILDCYVKPGWDIDIRPSGHARQWMDQTTERFAYRCLPLAIANSHGWEIGSPATFEAVWTGDNHPDGVQITILESGTAVPVGLFGYGVLTFHTYGLFRTSPGWNLWVSGPPNAPKDAIAPLSGVIETDWSPFSFTMNWKFTRPHTPVRFERGEPICFLFPVQRQLLQGIEPTIQPIASNPELGEQYDLWSQSRDAFQAQQKTAPSTGSGAWQKHYMHGTDMRGTAAEGHLSKLRLKEFRRG